MEMSQSSKPLAEERCSGDYYDMDYSQKWKIRSHILILTVRYVVRYGVDNLHNITYIPLTIKCQFLLIYGLDCMISKWYDMVLSIE